MPCGYFDNQYETRVVNVADAELTKLIKEYKAALDTLTHDMDMLREAIIGVDKSNPGLFDKKVMHIVNFDQIKHRKEDLARLKKTFKKSKDAEKLGLVMLADPKEPLEPQLGFDPDEY